MSSTPTKRHSRCRSEDTMDDDTDDKDDTKRKSRNLSEKKRRDQFNVLVNELSSMVSSGGRKMDKSTVLKSTISFLKNHNEIAVRSRVHEIHEDWKPAFLSNEEFTHLILEAVDGFIMVFSISGQIFYASESITALLGHLPSDVLSMTIYEMACEEEQNGLYSILLSPGGGDADARNNTEVTFSCHIRRGNVSESMQSFELVHFVGHFRSDADILQTDCSEADTRLVFVGTGRLETPQLIREMSVAESAKSEFTSRHSLEWKFLFLDHRAPPIIGYLPFELLGTSGYDYYHVDDLDMVVNCHEALMQKGEGTSCFYRFLTKGQQWIWLQTRFFITYHQWNSKPEFIVCTHRVISYGDAHSTKQTLPSDSGTTAPPVPVQLQLQLPPLPSVDSMLMSSAQSQLQSELQRKHAELQATIGQQQAELRRVSEQLLMARLGLLPSHAYVSSTTSAAVATATAAAAFLHE